MSDALQAVLSACARGQRAHLRGNLDEGEFEQLCEAYRAEHEDSEAGAREKRNTRCMSLSRSAQANQVEG